MDGRSRRQSEEVGGCNINCVAYFLPHCHVLGSRTPCAHTSILGLSALYPNVTSVGKALYIVGMTR